MAEEDEVRVDVTARIEAVARVIYAAAPSYFNGDPIGFDAAIFSEQGRMQMRQRARLALMALDPDLYDVAIRDARAHAAANHADPWGDGALPWPSLRMRLEIARREAAHLAQRIRDLGGDPDA